MFSVCTLIFPVCIVCDFLNVALLSKDVPLRYCWQIDNHSATRMKICQVNATMTTTLKRNAINYFNCFWGLFPAIRCSLVSQAAPRLHAAIRGRSYGVCMKNLFRKWALGSMYIDSFKRVNSPISCNIIIAQIATSRALLSLLNTKITHKYFSNRK